MAGSGIAQGLCMGVLFCTVLCTGLLFITMGYQARDGRAQTVSLHATVTVGGCTAFECTARANLTAYSRKLESYLLELTPWHKVGAERAATRSRFAAGPVSCKPAFFPL